MEKEQEPNNPGRGSSTPFSHYALVIGVGIPTTAAITVVYGWLAVPMLLVPAMYIMGLGPISIGIACAWSGLTWCAALTTWMRLRSFAAVLGGAAAGAAGFALTGLLTDMLGSWAPACGAIVAASLFSSVIEEPTVHSRLMAIFASAGGLAGAIVGSRLPQDDPRTALWIVIVALHGSIAVLTRSRWRRLTG